MALDAGGGKEFRGCWIEYSQGTDNEHQGHTDFLLPVKRELADLPQGDRNHPRIQGNADSSVRPADRVAIEAAFDESAWT